MSTLSFATELAAVEAAFAEPVRIPAIGDFAREISRELGLAEIEQADFIEAVWAHAEDGAFTFSPMTHAGCFLYEDSGLIPDSVELTADEANAQALMAMEFSPEFFNQYAHRYLYSIVQAMVEWRDSPERLREERLAYQDDDGMEGL